MMMNAAKINWARTGDALPAFLAIAIMPLTYSIGEFVAQAHVTAFSKEGACMPCKGAVNSQPPCYGCLQPGGAASPMSWGSLLWLCVLCPAPQPPQP